MIKVLIADDHPVVRLGLKKLLPSPSFEVVGEAQDYRELNELTERTRPEVLLLDLSMPYGNGLEAIERLSKTYPTTNILVLTISSGEQYALRCIEAGAKGFLNKETSPAVLSAAVAKAARGERVITSEVGDLLARSIGRSTESRARHERLSSQEFHVFREIAHGTSLTDIAAALGLSIKTISTYKQRVLAKMGLKSTADIVRYALQHELV